MLHFCVECERNLLGMVDKHLPMMALLLALSWRSFGILNTAFGNDKNKLCEMSKRNNCVKLANSSGNLLS